MADDRLDFPQYVQRWLLKFIFFSLHAAPDFIHLIQITDRVNSNGPQMENYVWSWQIKYSNYFPCIVWSNDLLI